MDTATALRTLTQFGIEYAQSLTTKPATSEAVLIHIRACNKALQPLIDTKSDTRRAND